jgi:small-conductance mechanosensitive channel
MSYLNNLIKFVEIFQYNYLNNILYIVKTTLYRCFCFICPAPPLLIMPLSYLFYKYIDTAGVELSKIFYNWLVDLFISTDRIHEINAAVP